MARYVLHVRTAIPPAEAFAYMADLTNFAKWDPGVDRVEQVEGDGAGADSAFDVAVKVPGRTTTLRYETTAYDEPTSMTAFAENALLTSEDTISVEPDGDGDGSIVTYDAELKLKGLLGLGDPVLKMTFNQIGDRAAAGLVEALAGERVAEPAS